MEVRPTLGRIVDEMHRSVGPVHMARTPPPAIYTSPDFYEFERRAVFGHSWLYLCHVSELATVGSIVSVTVGGEPLLVTRSGDGQLHVLSAVCRHRGHVIAEREDDAARLRCPYHYWTYALDGRLLGAPSMSPAHELETLRTSEGLLALRVEIWHGMVFATFDRDLPVLSHWLLGAGAAVSPYRIDEMVVAETVTLSGLEFNWKNMQENALEEYHTTYVHRGYHENAPAHLVRHGPFAPGDGAIYRHAGLLIGGGEPVPGRPTFPVIDRLPEIARHDFLFVAVPPLMFAVVRPDGVKMFRITPEAVDRTTLTISFLFPPTTLAIDGFDRLMDRQRELIELIDRPDLVTNAQVFRGLRSWNAPRGPYSPQETSLPQFNQWLLDRYTAGLNRQEAIS